MAAALAVCGGLVAVGKIDQPIGFDSLLELWGDVLRDADQAGMKVTRVSPEEEMRLGGELSAALLQSERTRPELEGMVQTVGRSLEPHVRRHIRYEFRVIDSPTINAYALPGGHVFVTSEMLNFVQSQDELASIVGHEMAHVDLRHCIEHYQYVLKARKLNATILGEVAQAARMIAAAEYNKYQEMDADAAGVRLAQAAGYDPKSGVRVFERLSRLNGEQAAGRAGSPAGEVGQAAAKAASDYFRSHPSSTERSSRLNELLRH